MVTNITSLVILVSIYFRDKASLTVLLHDYTCTMTVQLKSELPIKNLFCFSFFDMWIMPLHTKMASSATKYFNHWLACRCRCTLDEFLFKNIIIWALNLHNMCVSESCMSLSKQESCLMRRWFRTYMYFWVGIQWFAVPI